MKNNNDEEDIKSKIINADKQINDDLLLIPEYKLLTVYNKLSKIINQNDQIYLILRNKFLFIDKTLTGYINLKDFYDILTHNLPLEKDELKLILCDPALRNKINPKLYQYKPFFDLVRNFKEIDLLKMKQEYNIVQNPFIIKLKNELKSKKIDIKKLWDDSFKNGIQCTKENFNLLFVELKPDKYFHNLEIEYIFDIICKIGENNIKFEYFRDVMKKKTVPDIRVIYFKGLKELKEQEKENNEEKEKLLINYYPNVLENTNNNPINIENTNENTKYLIIKGEEIINNSENLNEKNNIDNKNEQFILGNSSVSVNDSNILKSSADFNTPKKKINTILDTLKISESLVIKAQPNINESQQIKDFVIDKKENKSIQYKKYYPKVYNIKRNELSKEKLNEIEELKNSTIIERKNSISKKLKNSNNMVNEILNRHEEYIVLKLYSSLKHQFSLLNEDILINFSNTDANNIKLLSLDDFMSVLQNDLKINLSKSDLNLLLNSLDNQDSQNSIFSYEEFFHNVKNINERNEERIKAIYNLALINFNSYFIELKQFINDKKIEIVEIFKACSNDKINLNLNEFIFFIKSINYTLNDNSEYKFIFDTLSKHPDKKLLSLKDFICFIDSEIISEEKFINDGKIDNNFKENKNKFWYKFIPKYNIKKMKIKEIEKISRIFDKINMQKIKFGINNLADLFASIHEINLIGNIKKEEFINAMKVLEINDLHLINDLLIFFEDPFNKMEFKLLNFLGLFSSLEAKEINDEIPPCNLKVNKRDPNIIYRNNYGFFTSVDLAKIKAFCQTIIEKISYIKRQSINHYFLKFDFYRKGYFTLRQLKTILIDDLDFKKHDLIDLFLSYILDKEKRNDCYIINLNVLLDIINKFVDKESEQQNSYNTFNYTNEIFNILVNSTIMNIRLNKKENANYYFSPKAGIE